MKAFSFLIRKLFFYILIFFIMLMVTFILPRMLPGNAILFTYYQALQTNPSLLQREGSLRVLMEYFDLDKPIWQQFINYIEKVFRGDLGRSMSRVYENVSDILFSRIPWSLLLLIPAYTSSWFIGNALGVRLAGKRSTRIESAVTTTLIVTYNIPYFILAFILILIFSVYLRIFPIGGGWDAGLQPSFTWGFISSYLWHYILPFLSIFIPGVANWYTGARAMSIYEYGSDYIEYLDNIGVSDKILRKYIYKNISLVQVTGFSISIGAAVGGLLLAEIVFSYPGVGYILYYAATRLDYTLIQGGFIIIASSVLAANYITDLIYALLDPRIRKGYVSI